MFRIWYLICLLFLISNINILIDESYETIYRMVNQNKPIQYLYCFNLSEIIINKTKINSDGIKNDFNHHLRWIQKNKKDRENKFISHEEIEKIINQTKSIDYLIYQNRLCFIFASVSDFEPFSEMTFKLPINQNYFIFSKETFSFLKLISGWFNQLSIQHKEYPYSGCSKDYSNFKCLNNKIKKIQRLSRYYYRSDDNESIELNYQINQTIIDNEIKIIKECNQIDCNINLLYHTEFYQKSESIILKSFLRIPEVDFYLQLIGLIVLLLNIPIYRLIIKIINSIDLRPLKIRLLRIKFIKLKFEKLKKILNKLNLKLRLNRIQLLIRKYFKINNLIRLILLICLAILFSRSIYNFIEKRDDPFNKTVSFDSIKPELFIVICIDVKKIKEIDYNIYDRSLSELEKESDNGLNIVLKDIYLEFLDKKIPTKWQLESKLIKFKYQIWFKRCFQLRIFLNQPKYQTIFSVTKLIIEFNKNKEGEIFILKDNEIFNSKSHQHEARFYFRKRILERSKLNTIKKCKDYNQIKDNCKSKWNCIDQCTTKKIYKQIKNLTQNELIDKNYFTDKEWSNLFIKPDSKYNKELYRNISKECEVKYSEFDPCVDIRFEKQNEVNYETSNKEVSKIDLNYEVIYYKEDEPSIFKLLLDLLNIQSNLFGFNFFSLSLIILGLFKCKNLKLIKIIKLFIYLLCSVGFIFHLRSIYDEIINTEIIFSEYYEMINSIQSPDLIFCLNFNHTKLINQNYKFSYQYLDKITSDQLREDLIFNSIEYLNQSYKWTKLYNETNFKDDNLEIEIFYYLDRKCFKIIQNIEYNINQFEFNKMDDGLVLKIFLNRSYLKNKVAVFFTKTKNKIQFSEIVELYLTYDYWTPKLFKIKHELILRDEFELIKNPLSFLYDDQNDLDKFFTKLINYLDTKLNLVTFKLPINKTELTLQKELDDNLFIQLYNQKQDQTNFNPNHLKSNSHNYLEIYEDFINSNLNPDFEFSLSFYRRVIVVSNKISLIKLIINLLNVLSFWFDLGILDLHHYLNLKNNNYYLFIFKLLPLLLYKLLIKIKNKLLSFII